VSSSSTSNKAWWEEASDWVHLQPGATVEVDTREGFGGLSVWTPATFVAWETGTGAYIVGVNCWMRVRMDLVLPTANLYGHSGDFKVRAGHVRVKS